MKPLKTTIVALMAAGTALTLSGCMYTKVDFSIDNPTDTTLNLRIDQTTYDIKPHSAQDISLPAGRHSMESAGTGKLEFIVYVESRGGLINPTLTLYVTANQVYAVSDAAATGFSPIKKTISIDGVPFQGPFALSDQLFIDKTWTYGVHENFPESITSYDRRSQGNIKSKLFTKEAFIAYFETNAGQPGYYARNKSTTPSTKPAPVPQPVALPVFTDPVVEAAAVKIKALYTDYLRAETADEQARLRQMSHKLIIEFVHVHATAAHKASAQENEKYDRLFNLVSGALGDSARIVS